MEKTFHLGNGRSLNIAKNNERLCIKEEGSSQRVFGQICLSEIDSQLEKALAGGLHPLCRLQGILYFRRAPPGQVVGVQKCDHRAFPTTVDRNAIRFRRHRAHTNAAASIIVSPKNCQRHSVD